MQIRIKLISLFILCGLLLVSTPTMVQANGEWGYSPETDIKQDNDSTGSTNSCNNPFEGTGIVTSVGSKDIQTTIVKSDDSITSQITRKVHDYIINKSNTYSRRNGGTSAGVRKVINDTIKDILDGSSSIKVETDYDDAVEEICKDVDCSDVDSSVFKKVKEDFNNGNNPDIGDTTNNASETPHTTYYCIDTKTKTYYPNNTNPKKYQWNEACPSGYTSSTYTTYTYSCPDKSGWTLAKKSQTLVKTTYTTKQTTTNACEYYRSETNSTPSDKTIKEDVYEIIEPIITDNSTKHPGGWVKINDNITIYITKPCWIKNNTIYFLNERQLTYSKYTYEAKIKNWYRAGISKDYIKFSTEKDVRFFEWYIYNTTNEDATTPSTTSHPYYYSDFANELKTVPNPNNIKNGHPVELSMPTNNIYYENVISGGGNQSSAKEGTPRMYNWGYKFWETTDTNLGQNLGNAKQNSFVLLPYTAKTKQGNKSITQVGTNYITRVPYAMYKFQMHVAMKEEYGFKITKASGLNGKGTAPIAVGDWLPAAPVGSVAYVSSKDDCTMYLKWVHGAENPHGAGNANLAFLNGNAIIDGTNGAAPSSTGDENVPYNAVNSKLEEKIRSILPSEADKIINILKSQNEGGRGTYMTYTDNNGLCDLTPIAAQVSNNSHGFVDEHYVATVIFAISATNQPGPYNKICINMGDEYTTENAMDKDKLSKGWPAGTQVVDLTSGDDTCDCTKFTGAACPDDDTSTTNKEEDKSNPHIQLIN